ncbi:aquaporin [Salmonella sp. WGH-01]|nr:aquaporin [Salmonella sp. WGH-01]
MNDSLKAQCGAEFLGTGLFCFWYRLFERAQSRRRQPRIMGDLHYLGLGISLAVYLTAGISGGHLNPAVTIALWLFACFPKQKVLPYIIAQFAGAFGGDLLAYVLYSSLLLNLRLRIIWCAVASKVCN